MRDDELLLTDIVEHARLVVNRAQNLSREAFDADVFIQFGLAHGIQIIGEAARLLSEPARAQFPSVPWKQIVGMRHRLVHEYFSVDTDRVWDTATIDLPALLRELEPVVGPLIEKKRSGGRGKDS